MSNNLHEDPSDIPKVEERFQPGRTVAPRTEQIRHSTPRRHDILFHPEHRNGGSFAAEDLSAYECARQLHEVPLFEADQPIFEVHFVDEERKLEAMEASKWLERFKNKVSKISRPMFVVVEDINNTMHKFENVVEVTPSESGEQLLIEQTEGRLHEFNWNHVIRWSQFKNDE